MSLIERVAQNIDVPHRSQAETRFQGGQRRDRAAEVVGGGSKDARMAWTHPREAVARGPASEPVPFSLPFKRLAKCGFVTPDSRRSRLSEEVRLIKHQLMRQMDLDESRLAAGDTIVLVTSARLGEGKSFIALNLALSFAIDERIPVLLIDGDYARSAYERLLGVPRSPGLIDILLDPSLALEGTMRCANGLPLAFLPPGTITASAADLYAGPRMASLLRQACQGHPRRMVIIDGPPVLSTTEAIVLATQATEILLIVDADHTAKTTLHSALDLLAPFKNVSLVLNMAARGGAEHFGRYHVPHGRTAAETASVSLRLEEPTSI